MEYGSFVLSAVSLMYKCITIKIMIMATKVTVITKYCWNSITESSEPPHNPATKVF